MLLVDPHLLEEQQPLVCRGLLINLDYALQVFLGTFGQISDYTETTSGDETETECRNGTQANSSIQSKATVNPAIAASGSPAKPTTVNEDSQATTGKQKKQVHGHRTVCTIKSCITSIF